MALTPHQRLSESGLIAILQRCERSAGVSPVGGRQPPLTPPCPPQYIGGDKGGFKGGRATLMPALRFTNHLGLLYAIEV